MSKSRSLSQFAMPTSEDIENSSHRPSDLKCMSVLREHVKRKNPGTSLFIVIKTISDQGKNYSKIMPQIAQQMIRESQRLDL